MKLDKHSKLVMIGDSITDAGRAQPAGEGLFGALGGGFSLPWVSYPRTND